jgi:hypothetical protein
VMSFFTSTWSVVSKVQWNGVPRPVIQICCHSLRLRI